MLLFLTVHIEFIFDKTDEIAGIFHCLIDDNIWAQQYTMIVVVFTNRQVGYHRDLWEEKYVTSLVQDSNPFVQV